MVELFADRLGCAEAEKTGELRIGAHDAHFLIDNADCFRCVLDDLFEVGFFYCERNFDAMAVRRRIGQGGLGDVGEDRRTTRIKDIPERLHPRQFVRSFCRGDFLTHTDSPFPACTSDYVKWVALFTDSYGGNAVSNEEKQNLIGKSWSSRMRLTTQR